MKGVLLINLGSPDNPGIPAVRCYLRQFLMDERVIDLPWLARTALVEGCILPFRPRRSAEAYQSIWTADGSPLLVYSESVRARLQLRLDCHVALGMRYGNPSTPWAIRNLLQAGVADICVVPLYPHYAMSSYETALVHAVESIPGTIPYSVVSPFYDHPAYIRALYTSAAESLSKGFDHLLFSFHGIPLRHLQKRGCKGCFDSPCGSETCYLSHCLKTVQAFARMAALSPDQYSVAFQSRLGRDRWLQPRTDVEIARLARNGVRDLAVICPSFVSDCLETLEEIGIRGKEIFKAAGGRRFDVVPCLNDHPAFIDALAGLVEANANRSALSECRPIAAYGCPEGVSPKSRRIGATARNRAGRP